MVLKLQFMQDKSMPKASLTDWAKLGGDRNPQRLLLPDMPSVLVRPQPGQMGKVNYHGKKLDFSFDNTFEYGGWPQKKALPIIQEKLNQALLNGKLRSNNGHYYTLNGQACQEYEFEKNLYVLVENKDVWLEVLPVLWKMDETRQQAYSTQVVIADIQKSEKFIRLVGQQILQSNKYLRECTSKGEEKKFYKKGILNQLFFIRYEAYVIWNNNQV